MTINETRTHIEQAIQLAQCALDAIRQQLSTELLTSMGEWHNNKQQEGIPASRPLHNCADALEEAILDLEAADHALHVRKDADDDHASKSSAGNS